MKFAAAVLIGSVQAAWGTWNQSAYCNYNSEEVDATMMISTEAECAAFCKEADMNALNIPYGTKECCDFEDWGDGTYDCTLYMGNEEHITDSPYNGFSSMEFESGDYHYAVSLAGRSKMQDALRK